MSPDRRAAEEISRISDRIEYDPNGGCWLWSGATHRGYGRIRARGENLLTHRLMWSGVNGPIPDGMFICHKCDVPACCNPEHLFVGTREQNMQDMIRKNRHAKGAQTGGKLTPEEVRSIRSEPGTLRAVGQKFGIDHKDVFAIKSGRSWKHVPDHPQQQGEKP